MSLFLILLIVWWQFKYFFYGIDSGVNLYDIQAIEFYNKCIYLLQFWVKLPVFERTKSQDRKSQWVIFFRISTWANSWLWWAEDWRWPPWPRTHPGYLGYWRGLPLCHHSRIPLCQRGYGHHAGTTRAIFYSCVSLIGRCTFLIILRTLSQVFPETDSSEDLGTEGPTECDCDPGEPGFAGFAGPKVLSHYWNSDLSQVSELGRGSRVYQRSAPSRTLHQRNWSEVLVLNQKNQSSMSLWSVFISKVWFVLMYFFSQGFRGVQGMNGEPGAQGRQVREADICPKI